MMRKHGAAEHDATQKEKTHGAAEHVHKHNEICVVLQST